MLRPGAKIGTILIQEPLGQGGMGLVWAGFDEKLRREVAVTEVRAERLDAETRARLLAEARILSRLDHPRICRVYDYLEVEDRGFLILERVRGKELSQAPPAPAV